MLEFLFYLASGRLLIWFLQVNGLLRPIWNWKPTLRELGDCDLCLGFWVYLGMGSLTDLSFDLWPRPLELVILAALSSFTAHLLRLGWQAKFGGVIIDNGS